jgi:general secretion pathway protein E
MVEQNPQSPAHLLLGHILVTQFQVSETDLRRGLDFQDKYGGRLGEVLINMGVISENILLNALSRQLGCPVFADYKKGRQLDLNRPQLWEPFNVLFLKKKKCIPVEVDPEEGSFHFAVNDPLDVELIEYLESMEMAVHFVLCGQQEMRELASEFDRYFEISKGLDGAVSQISEDEIDRLKEMASEAPIINLVNILISRGVEKSASDLHIEPYGRLYRVRYRIDGQLYDADVLPEHVQLPVISRIKILAGMDIAEKRLPQDGKIGMRLAGREMDIRVSALPLLEGESMVLRFLFKDTEFVELETLGFEPDTLSMIREDIQRTSGVILITGPTGSGKSTTLYAVLKEINRPEVKIITAEDPVEYRLEGINQIQVHPEIGYGFAHALRSILRQDPDVLMVGEIRDRETVEIALQSALTGHLVFSTLHTNDAIGSVTRLLDLGVEEFLLNGTIVALCAQRLVRKICPECRVEDPEAMALLSHDGVREIARKICGESPRFLRGKGCEACNQTGFSGRIPIMEYIPYDYTLKVMEKNAAFPSRAWEYQHQLGRRNLIEDGFVKVRNGITTVQEVLRVAG